MPEPKPLLGLAAALTVVIVWAGFLLISRHGLRADIQPADMAALRFGVSGAVMLPFLLARGTGGLTLLQALALGLTGGLGFAVLVYLGFANAPAAYAAILLPGVLPLFTTLLAWLILRDRLRRQQVPALVLIALGIAVLAIGTLHDGDMHALQGAACFLVASCSWGCFTVLLRRWKLEALQATAVVAVVACIIYMPLYFIFTTSGLPLLPWSTLIIQGAYQGIGAVIVSLLAFTVAVRNLGPATTTMITASTPAVVAVAAIWLLDEPLTPAIAIGVAAVVAGGILTARAAIRSSPRPVTPVNAARTERGC